jgi:phosphatidylglycerophosphatase A
MNSKTDADAPAAARRTPVLSLLLATGLGAGYIPFAPGTWGSVEGVAITFFSASFLSGSFFSAPFFSGSFLSAWWITGRASAPAPHLPLRLFGLPGAAALILLFLLGVAAASRVASYLRAEDPQCVVVDEIFGQCLTFFLAPSLNWRYLALGFILFRAFDIWKPFPVRQAESLPAGWGIMADDGLAALYAAAGLWIARAAGLPA